MLNKCLNQCKFGSKWSQLFNCFGTQLKAPYAIAPYHRTVVSENQWLCAQVRTYHGEAAIQLTQPQGQNKEEEPESTQNQVGITKG